jgi:hypothetical protein
VQNANNRGKLAAKSELQLAVAAAMLKKLDEDIVSVKDEEHNNDRTQKYLILYEFLHVIKIHDPPHL